MSATVGTLTIESAPRDPEKLANIGRFQLRRLAETLGLCDTEPKKNAFMSGTPVEMAQAVATALKIKDAPGGGAPAANGAPAAAAQQEAPPPEETREPATPRGRARAAAQTAAPAAANAEELVASINKALEVQFAASGKAQQAQLSQLTAAVLGLAEQNKFLFSLILMMAEERINASRAEILRQAVADAQNVGEDLAYAIKQINEAAGKG